jgi:uncharacterized membrane protein (GlpM family)
VRWCTCRHGFVGTPRPDGTRHCEDHRGGDRRVLHPARPAHDNSALATAAATVPIATIIGLIAFASGDPAGAQTFARSAVLALPVWSSFAVATFLLTRVLDWRLALGAARLVWLGAALVYLHLTRS